MGSTRTQKYQLVLKLRLLPFWLLFSLSLRAKCGGQHVVQPHRGQVPGAGPHHQAAVQVEETAHAQSRVVRAASRARGGSDAHGAFAHDKISERRRGGAIQPSARPRPTKALSAEHRSRRKGREEAQILATAPKHCKTRPVPSGAMGRPQATASGAALAGHVACTCGLRLALPRPCD
jgi:hypothetical protein